jgi:chromate transporter
MSADAASSGTNTPAGAGGEPVVPGSGGDVIPFAQAARAWFAISLQTFGGPAGQIAVMQRTLVEGKRWIGHQRFLFALS